MDNLGNNDINEPIPFDSGGTEGSSPVSRAPLNLGGSSGPRPTPTPRPPAPARPAPPKIITSTPINTSGGASVTSSSGARITGMKTFFAKLHAGALEFLDEQITTWLKENPDVHIKHTNIATGDVQAKKTEPNILITVWY